MNLFVDFGKIYYLNNRIFYADLDSVKLKEVEGYEEAKEMLNTPK